MQIKERKKNISAVYVHFSEAPYFLTTAEAKKTYEVLAKKSLKLIKEGFPETPIHTNSIPLEFINSSEILYIDEDLAQGRVEKKEEGDVKLIKNVRDIFKKYPAKQEKERKEFYNMDTIAIFYTWYPLLDLPLSKEIITEHFKYLANFSYGENLPLGFVPDLITRDATDILAPELLEKLSLRNFIFKNIEKFDLEIFYKAPDLRQYRLNFSLEDSRSMKLVSESIKKSKEAIELNYKNLEKFLTEYPELMRPYPSYFEVELSTKTPVCFNYTPSWNSYQEVLLSKEKEESNDKEKTIDKKNYQRQKFYHLEENVFHKILRSIEKAPLAYDTTLCLGGLGDAMAHPKFFLFLERAAEIKNITCIYLETFGLLLTEENIALLGDIFQKEKTTTRLDIILRLSTIRRDRYKEFYGIDSLSEILKNIKVFDQSLSKNKNSKIKLYAEMLRLKQNEDELEGYFEYFKGTNVTPFLSKFNRYISLLEDHKAVDLSPLHRDVCWHLSRDFYVNALGLVPLCKQDPFGQQSLLSSKKNSKSPEYYAISIAELSEEINETEDPILKIWNSTKKYHKFSFQNKHQKIPMPCLACDEWYNFNA